MIDNVRALIRDLLPIPPPLAIGAGGFVAHVLLNQVLDRPWHSTVGLLAPLVLDVVFESLEIFEVYRDRQFLVSTEDSWMAVLFRHGQDVLIVLAAPALLVAIGRWKANL